MSKAKTTSKFKKRKQENSSAPPYGEAQLADGGELHQIAGGEHPSLTTNQGVALSDNQNSLTANPRGPTLLEDFILREKSLPFRSRAHSGTYCSCTGDGSACVFRADRLLKSIHHGQNTHRGW
jgi:hypothetical protein